MTYNDELTVKLDEQLHDILKYLPDFSKKFFGYLQDSNKSPRTCQQYAYDMKKFFDFIADSAGFKDKNLKGISPEDILDKLTVDDIHEYARSLEFFEYTDKNGNKKKKPASVAIRARRASALRSFYRYYYKIGDIKNNLADLIPVPEIKDKAIVTMDKDQVSRILKAVTDTTGMNSRALTTHELRMRRDYAILMLFFGTGLRVSELVGIDVRDVDFYNCSINVTRKGGNADVVYFGTEVEYALSDYLEIDRPILLSGRDEEAFFLSLQHKRLGVRSVELMMKDYAQRAGLNIKVTPHTLRRTFGTHLYETTGDIYLVADALHHASVETTKKHYAKMSEDHKRIAAKESSSLFDDK